MIRTLNQTQRNEVEEACKGQSRYDTHIQPVLMKNTYCYVANLFASDYDELLIYSDLPDAGEPTRQPISKVIAYIKAHPDILKESRYDGWLSCGKVKLYIEQLNASLISLQDSFSQLGCCFVEDRSNQMNPIVNDVTDGMHRLTAYGLATDLNESYFPIQIYYGTNKNLETSELH